jgi:hypothetical protein
VGQVGAEVTAGDTADVLAGPVAGPPAGLSEPPAGNRPRSVALCGRVGSLGIAAEGGGGGADGSAADDVVSPPGVSSTGGWAPGSGTQLWQ